MKVVEAHEVAHIRLKHQMGERDAEDEIDADIHAMFYLAKGGYNKAVKIIKEQPHHQLR